MCETGKHLVENIGRSGRYDGSRELIPVFHNPHRIGRPSPLVVALIFDYFVGCSLRPRRVGGRNQYPKDP